MNRPAIDIDYEMDLLVDELAQTPIEESPQRSSTGSVAMDITTPNERDVQPVDVVLSDAAVSAESTAPQIVDKAAEQSTAADMTQSDMRKRMLAIQMDTSLSISEKGRMMQALMMRRPIETLKMPMKHEHGHHDHHHDHGADCHQQVLQGNSVEVKDNCGNTHSLPKSALETSHHTVAETGEKHLGCEHYCRGVKIQASCCSEWFVCRFCHDAETDHKLNRHATKTVLCMECKTPQGASQTCQNTECNASFGRYYCDVCKLWDDTPDKKIFHCDKCGICRLGEGEGVDYFHCDKCNVCLSMSLKDKHRCIERNLESDCPICGDYMFTSTSPVIFMPCSHGIHYDCYQDHVKNSYQCPICWKSLADMTHYFKQIDRMLEQHKMPVEYEDFYSTILCNDCCVHSKTKYHFLYHKCQECNGYNTKLISTAQERRTTTTTDDGDMEEEVVIVQNVDLPAGSSLLSPDATGNHAVGSAGLRTRTISALSSSASTEGYLTPDDNESPSRNFRSPL